MGFILVGISFALECYVLVGEMSGLDVGLLSSEIFGCSAFSTIRKLAILKDSEVIKKKVAYLGLTDSLRI